METISIPIDQLLQEAPNYTINQLAERYSTDYGAIYRILSRYKVEAKSRTVTKEALEVVFEEPRTLQEAADILNVTPSTVGAALKKFGIFGGRRKPTTKGLFVGERSFKVLGHLLNHPEENLASVGRRFNVTREYVRQIKACAVNEGIIKQEAESYEQ